MRAKLLLIFAYFNLTGSLLIGQEKAIEIRFKGGEKALRELLAHNLRYPEKALENKIVGYSIIGITITPDGQIFEISKINPIDKSIEKDIYRVLRMTNKKWLSCDTVSTNQTFYIQIIYLVNPFGEPPYFINPVNNKYNFIEPIEVVAISFKGDRLPETDESIATKFYEKLKRNDYGEALDYINELIRRNPFNKELYQFRISINRKLENNDSIITDSEKMLNFIPGVSLDEIIKKN